MYKWLWDRTTGTIKGILKVHVQPTFGSTQLADMQVSPLQRVTREFLEGRELLIIWYAYVLLYIENHVQGTVAFLGFSSGGCSLRPCRAELRMCMRITCIRANFLR